MYTLILNFILRSMKTLLILNSNNYNNNKL